MKCSSARARLSSTIVEYYTHRPSTALAPGLIPPLPLQVPPALHPELARLAAPYLSAEDRRTYLSNPAAPAAPNMLPADLGEMIDEPSSSLATPPTPSAAPHPSTDTGLEGLLNGVLEQMTEEEAMEVLLTIN